MPKISGNAGEKIDLYKRINKQLSHIAKSRLIGQEDFFDKRELYKEIFNNIKKAFEKYDQEITDNNYKVLFR